MKVVVIGGGIAGLATAGLLAREGHDVELIEKNAHLGGRVGRWERDGFRFDTGPSWYLMPEVFEHFFALMGTSAAEQLDLVKLDPGYRVYSEGYAGPLDLSASRAANEALFDAEEPGAGARLHRYLDEAAEVYDLAGRSFLYTTFAKLGSLATRPVLARSPRLIRLLLQSLDARVRRVVRDRRLRQVLGYPAVLLGSSPRLAPSMYELMSHLDLDDGVWYPRGGFTTLIDAIARLAIDAGVRMRPSTPVRRILVEGGRAVGVEVDAADGMERIAADLVVSAADLHHTETVLLEPAHRSYPEPWWGSRVPGPSALVALLGVEGEVPELAHHTLFFAEDWDAGFEAIFGRDPHIPDRPSVYVCAPSGIDPTVAPPGMTNLFVLVPITADPAIGAGGIDGAGDAAVEALADRVIAQIAQAAGVPDLAARIRVRRTIGPADFAADYHSWRGNALGLAHTLRQSAFFRAGNASRRVEGLLYAGATTIPGIGLPMCLISAELVVKRLRGDTSTTPLPEPVRAAS